MHLQQLLSCLLTGLLISLPLQGMASTQAGELEVVEIDPDNNKLVVKINFMEYFSAPGEFMPGMRWTSRQKAGPFADRTMWMIDGRPVHWKIGAAALKPGDHIYHYGSRHTTEFINIYSHKPVTVGAYQQHSGDSLELLRLMLRRYDTDAAVYQRFAPTIDADAQFLLAGAPSDASAVLQKGHFIRVLPRQELIVSAFTDEATLSVDGYYEKHQGARQGYIQGVEEKVVKGKKQPGFLLQLRDGENMWRGIDRKGYMVLDGNYFPSRTPVLRQGYFAAMGVYRGWEKAKYVLVRSQAMGAIDGRIAQVASDHMLVTLDAGQGEQRVPLNNDAIFKLNGQPVTAKQALRVGRVVTVFAPRPQVIEAWKMGQPRPGYAGKDEHYAIIEYTPTGERRVIKDGYNPYFDSPKVKETPPSINAGPPGHDKLSREEAMRVWTGE